MESITTCELALGAVQDLNINLLIYLLLLNRHGKND